MKMNPELPRMFEQAGQADWPVGAGRRDGSRSGSNGQAAWRALRRFKWLPTLGALLGTLLALAVTQWLPPTYEAAARLLVEPDPSSMVSFDATAAPPRDERDRLRTQVQLVASREVGLQVIEALDLSRQPEFAAAPARAASDPPATAAVVLDPRQSASLKAYFQRLTVEPLRDTQLVEIRFRSRDPVLAAQIANQVGRSYIDVGNAMRLNAMLEASTLLSTKLGELKMRLDQSESRLLAYEREQVLSDERLPAGGSAVQQVATLNDQLMQARIERTRLAQLDEQLQGAAADPSSPALASDAAVGRAREQIAVAEDRLAQARSTYGRAHPSYQNAAAQVRAARAALSGAIAAARDTVAAQLELARQQEASLGESLDRARGELQDTNSKVAVLTQLRQAVEVDRQLYQTFLARTNQTSAAAHVLNPVARLVDPAIAPAEPVAPRARLIVSVSLLLGLAFGAALALWRDRQDRSLRALDDVESRLGVSLLGALPSFPDALRRQRGRLVDRHPTEFVSEAIRGVAARIALLLPTDGQSRSLAVISALSQEGKSTIACNLALEMAHGRRVLLIDADVHRRRASTLAGIPPDHTGLVQVLTGRAELRHAVCRVRGSGLVVLPAGAAPGTRRPGYRSPRCRRSWAGWASGSTSSSWTRRPWKQSRRAWSSPAPASRPSWWCVPAARRSRSLNRHWPNCVR